MFKKLLSNLPFNPSLITQVSFYAKRVHAEASVRRLGVAFMALALVVQMFAVISPAEPTLAESTNDVLRGGFRSRQEAVTKCVNNTENFRDVLAYYQIDCDILSRAATIDKLSSRAEGGELDSLGRNDPGSYIYRPKTNKTNPTDRYIVDIPNAGRFYMKNLWAWDSYSHSEYKVLSMKNKQGQTIMIMYDCGNIVTYKKYSPPPPPAPPTPAPAPKPAPPVDACPETPEFQKTKEECDVCTNIPGIQKPGDECYPCPEAESDSNNIACLGFNKTARNDTQGILDANETMAAAGDVIEYTLSVQNIGRIDFVDFKLEENLADVLEYANIVDLDGGELNDETKVATWTKANIKIGGALVKKIVVKIKSPIPQTPVSASDPGSYDLVMTNVFYGKSINIELPAAPHKQIEIVNNTLPNTGPGETLAVGFALFTIMGYFFARSRQMAEELDIVKEEYAAGL